MHSYRVLGIIALGAIVLAAICFTAVDITIDSANGCLGVRRICSEHQVPSTAVGYAALGVLSLLISTLFAAGWLIGMLRHPEPDEPLPRVRLLPRVVEEEL
ncbi:hypothetical protein GCM10009840_25220 [Pseudolysinimonas kribbensis]|uniref:Uncharacterized protein n=1 Tax=Pseudolysinimonas kribbensis TaxID=433641 RepID=A0ABQ6KAY5_9MICO|nr:hypothetical protein GCM10025881_35190 [Pseudolysinimonas kribbensis]